MSWSVAASAHFVLWKVEVLNENFSILCLSFCIVVFLLCIHRDCPFQPALARNSPFFLGCVSPSRDWSLKMWCVRWGGSILITLDEVQSPGNSYSCLCGKNYKDNYFNLKIFELLEKTNPLSSLQCFSFLKVSHADWCFSLSDVIKVRSIAPEFTHGWPSGQD